MSKGRAAELRRYSKARAEFLRLKPWCGRCNLRGKEVHHTRGRVGKLLLDWRYWMTTCPACHEWIGRNPAKAREKGFLCAAGLWNTPDPTPIPPMPTHE